METINLIMPSTNMVALDNNWKNEAEEAILVSEKQEEQQPKRSPFIEANTNEVTLEHQIGRASCRERVQISVVAVSLKKKNKKNTKKKKKKKCDSR